MLRFTLLLWFIYLTISFESGSCEEKQNQTAKVVTKNISNNNNNNNSSSNKTIDSSSSVTEKPAERAARSAMFVIAGICAIMVAVSITLFVLQQRHVANMVKENKGHQTDPGQGAPDEGQERLLGEEGADQVAFSLTNPSPPGEIIEAAEPLPPENEVGGQVSLDMGTGSKVIPDPESAQPEVEATQMGLAVPPKTGDSVAPVAPLPTQPGQSPSNALALSPSNVTVATVAGGSKVSMVTMQSNQGATPEVDDNVSLPVSSHRNQMQEGQTQDLPAKVYDNEHTNFKPPEPEPFYRKAH